MCHYLKFQEKFIEKKRFFEGSETYGTNYIPGRPHKLDHREKRFLLQEASKGKLLVGSSKHAGFESEVQHADTFGEVDF